MNTQPLVSVVVPAYRAAGFIRRTLESVLAQTWPRVEVIVVNDGSPDTPELEQAISDIRKHVHYMWQPNAGAAAARNAGLRAADGELVAFLDADDRWTAEHLSEQVAFLLSHPECDAVYADAWIEGDTRAAGERFMDRAPSRGAVTIESLLSSQCTVVTSAMVARTGVIRAAGGFDEALRRGQDFDLWLRLLHQGCCIRYQRKPLVYRLVHGGNLSADPIDEHQRVITVLEKPLWRTLSGRARELADRRIAHHRSAIALEEGKRSLAGGNIEKARAYFERAASSLRSWKLAAARLGLRVAPQLTTAAYRRRTNHY